MRSLRQPIILLSRVCCCRRCCRCCCYRCCRCDYYLCDCRVLFGSHLNMAWGPKLSSLRERLRWQRVVNAASLAFPRAEGWHNRWHGVCAPPTSSAPATLSVALTLTRPRLRGEGSACACDPQRRPRRPILRRNIMDISPIHASCTIAINLQSLDDAACLPCRRRQLPQPPPTRRWTAIVTAATM